MKKSKQKIKTQLSSEQTNSSDKDLSTRIEKRFPGFEKGWDHLVREMGSEIVDFLKDKIQIEYSFLKNLKNFKLKLVVDNNFVLGQIKGAIKKNESIEKSFIYKLLTMSSVEIFAPYLLKEELEEKVHNVIREEDRNLAVEYSAMLIPKMKIQDAQWTDNWRNAKISIGGTDPDDVPYLALALEIGSHAIVSFDNVFLKQGDVKVWKHKETDEIIANYHSGFISFFIMGNVGELLAKLIAVLYKFVRDVIRELIELLVSLSASIVVGISKIPPAILVLLVTLGIIFFDEIKNAGKDFIGYVVKKGKEIIAELKIVIAEISELLKKVIDVITLSGTVAFEFLGFLLTEYNDLNARLQELSFEKESDIKLAS